MKRVFIPLWKALEDAHKMGYPEDYGFMACYAEFNNKIDTIRFIMQMVKYAKADRDSITIWDSEGHEVLQGVVR